MLWIIPRYVSPKFTTMYSKVHVLVFAILNRRQGCFARDLCVSLRWHFGLMKPGCWLQSTPFVVAFSAAILVTVFLFVTCYLISRLSWIKSHSNRFILVGCHRFAVVGARHGASSSLSDETTNLCQLLEPRGVFPTDRVISERLFPCLYEIEIRVVATSDFHAPFMWRFWASLLCKPLKSHSSFSTASMMSIFGLSDSAVYSAFVGVELEFS
jgi:hypothetical protein